MDNTVQNTGATKDALFQKAANMMSTEANMSALEYELDTVATLLMSLISDFQAASGTLSTETQKRMANLQGFLQYSSINFAALDEGSMMEVWKIPYAISLKAEVRSIQAWYLSTKARLFGSILV